MDTTLTVTLKLDGIPPKCPHCDSPPYTGSWGLTMQGHQLALMCLQCFTAIAAVRAAAGKEA